MAYEKSCLNCRKEFSGNINKFFCSDACRKYFKRHNGGLPLGSVKSPEQPTSNSQLSGQGRTTTGSGLVNYGMKRLMDVVAHRLKNGKPENVENDEQLPELVSRNLELNATMSTILGRSTPVPLKEDWASFLGNLSGPFKILVWGAAGQGKSTFCLKLADTLCSIGDGLYISGEEEPMGATFRGKEVRCIAQENRRKIHVINRLPTIKEWPGQLYDQLGKLKVKSILYDSISALRTSPMYPAETSRALNNTDFNKLVNHIFIAHADKDAKSYKGNSSYGHEVDVIVRCSNGMAEIQKNRFATGDGRGQIGAAFKVF